MSYSGDAAEQVVRMSLETGEVAVRLAGSGAKQLAILLYAILREQKKTAGKARLTNMLRSGKELKVFAVKDSDLQLFCREAKKYGVLYCVLKDRDATDGLTDIMARAEDASKINRIIERFGLATVDTVCCAGPYPPVYFCRGTQPECGQELSQKLCRRLSGGSRHRAGLYHLLRVRQFPACC